MKKATTLLSLIFFSYYSIACRCLETNVNEEIAKVDYIVSGKVVEIIESGEPYCRANSGYKIKLIVYTTYKGLFTTDTIIIESNAADCSICFKLDEEYLIFGNQYDNNYNSTDMCRRTRILKDNEDIAVLEKIKGDEVVK